MQSWLFLSQASDGRALCRELDGRCRNQTAQGEGREEGTEASQGHIPGNGPRRRETRSGEAVPQNGLRDSSGRFQDAHGWAEPLLGGMTDPQQGSVLGRAVGRREKNGVCCVVWWGEGPTF